VIHTVLVDDAVRAARIGKAIAAGFYEYAPYLFDAPHLVWDGPPIDALKRRVWPDFHHAADLDAAAALVHFLPDTAADDFALHGPPTQVATRLEHLLSLGIDFDILVPHPVPPPPPPGDASPSTYMRRFIDEVARPLGL